MNKSQIFCDMDGVLVDLFGKIIKYSKLSSMMIVQNGVQEIIEKKLLFQDECTKEHKMAKNFIVQLISDNERFWRELKPTEDCLKLWNFISPWKANILTSPWDEACARGKLAWIDEYLKPKPNEICMLEGKEKYATTKEGNPNILIDDFEKYIIPWREQGGIGILHENSEDTIRHLKPHLTTLFLGGRVLKL